jgi:hypothetical protein
MSETWDKANTGDPAELLAHYEKTKVLTWVQYNYETWRKTTAMVHPPAPWDDLCDRVKVAMCAVASAERWNEE